tara:strand:+ start:74 stop:631 length:558 start_codon:yes stop_codon:yes gene_type:complete
MECLEKPINFNNLDGSFNRDKWLDFMNTKINSIGFYSAWTGHTAKIVNKQSKDINFFRCVLLDDEDRRNLDGMISYYTDFYSRTKGFYGADRWDKEKGWVYPKKEKEFGNSFGYFMSNIRNNRLNDLPKERTLYKVAMDKKVQFVLYMPEYNAVRTLGYWEYAGLGLKKYIYFKYENYLKKLGVL